MPSGYPSECDLRATADGLIVRANVAATVPLIHLAVDVVQHEAHVVVHIPVQAERDVLLPTAEDILVVEIDNRPEERRVGNECGSTCRSRWSQENLKKTTNNNPHR